MEPKSLKRLPKLSGRSPKSQKGSETVRAQKAQKLSGRSLKRSVSPKKCRKLSGRSPKKRRSKRPQSPKRLENCPGGAQKGPETVRRSPKKLRNWKDLKRLRNCPGAQASTKLSREEPKKAQKLSGRIWARGSPSAKLLWTRNCPGGAQKGPESVREEHQNAQKLSGKSPKKLRNCPGGACRNCPRGGSVLVKFQKTRTHPEPSISVLKNRIFNWDPGRSWGCPHLGCFWLKPVKARFWSKIQKTRTHPEPSISILKNRIFNWGAGRSWGPPHLKRFWRQTFPFKGGSELWARGVSEY